MTEHHLSVLGEPKMRNSNFSSLCSLGMGMLTRPELGTPFG